MAGDMSIAPSLSAEADT